MTYNQCANKFLHLIAAELKILIGARKLCEIERCLLLPERAPCEVGSVQLAWNSDAGLLEWRAMMFLMDSSTLRSVSTWRQ